MREERIRRERERLREERIRLEQERLIEERLRQEEQTRAERHRELERFRSVRRSAAESNEERAARLEADRDRQQRNANRSSLNDLGYSYEPEYDYENIQYLNIASLSKRCRFCAALCFESEAPGICFCQGKVKLPTIREPPAHIFILFEAQTDISKIFLSQIRMYNCCFK